jgi:hypothetical protein
MSNITEHIDKANDGNICSMLFLGDYYKRKKEYCNMLKFYLFAIEIADNDIAKEKIGKYFEFIKNDYDQALIFYKKIDDNNNHVKRIEEKCYSLLEIAMENTIILNKKCKLCYNKNVDIYRLDTCCRQKICIRCVCGILNINTNFICPYCRNIIKIDNKKNILFIDTDSDISEDDLHFINGIYYEDDYEDDYDYDYEISN